MQQICPYDSYIPIKVLNHGNIRHNFTYINDIIEGTQEYIDKNYR